MLLSPTVRSNAYLQTLLKYEFVPSIVLLMKDPENPQLPGMIPDNQLVKLKKQFDLYKYFNVDISVEDLLIKHNINYLVLQTKDINSDLVTDCLKNRRENYFIYSGIGGAILKKEILSIGKYFLHMHSGSVPDYKGSTTLYYSILNENKCAVSAFFLKEEIDTGQPIKIKYYDLPDSGLLIDYIYDPYIRADLLVEVIKEYLIHNKFKASELPAKSEETYFIIHPVLKHIVYKMLNK